MEGLLKLIVLFVIYRAFVDRKKGNARSASSERTEQKVEQQINIPRMFEQFFPLGDENYEVYEEKTNLDFRESEDVAEPIVQHLPKAMVNTNVKVEAGARCPKRPLSPEVDLKQAIIWSEILQKPKALRRR